MSTTPQSVSAHLDFAQSLAQASGIEELERAYLDGIRRLLPFPMHGVYLFDPDTQRVDRIAAVNVSDAFLNRYERLGRDEDPIIARVTGERRLGYSLDVAGSAERWLASHVYREVFCLHGMVHAAQAPVLDDDRLIGTVAIGAREDCPRLTAAQLNGLELAARAFALAHRVVCRAEQVARERDRTAAALELANVPVVITAPREEPRPNRAAAELLDATIEGRDLLYPLLARPAARSERFTREARVTWRDGGGGVLRAHSHGSRADPGGLITLLECDRRDVAPQRAGWGALTDREREVAALVLQGLSNPAIAERLVLSPHTVKQYVKRIYRKLGVRSRVELARRALG